jgi:hypothetical protein
MVNFQGGMLLKLVNFQGNHFGYRKPLPHAQLFDHHLENRWVVLNFIGHRCEKEFLDRSEIAIEQLYV